MIEALVDLSKGEESMPYSTCYVAEHFTVSDKPLFWCRIIPNERFDDRTIRLSGTRYDDAVWCIDHYNTAKFYVNRKNTTRELLIEFLLANYPNQLEWLLWNPGWL